MKSRFKVVGLLSVFLLLFALGGVASADVATDVSVAISYPCEQGEVCDEEGVAVSRSSGDFGGVGGPGDDVNVYITLLDANGNPATEGPNGEDLDGLTGDIESELGTAVDSGDFLAQTGIVFTGDSAGRGVVNYTLSQVGTDKVEVSIFGNPVTISGSASVNVVAPPGVNLIARTCPDAPETLYDGIDDPCNNSDDAEEAGSPVTVTVIADEGDGLYTTAPNLEGRQVTVCAYADYDASGTAGDTDEEKEAIECGDFTMNDGIAQGSLTIDRAGIVNDFEPGIPAGLLVVFTATAEDADGMTVESDQIDEDNDISLFDWDVDTVVMVPGDADAIKVAEDVFGNGNYIMVPDGDCLSILDDSGPCAGPGTPEDITIVVCDALGNAVDPDGTVTVTGTLPGILDDQLSGCETTVIGGYADTCTLQDTNGADAGVGIPTGLLQLSSDPLDGDDVSVLLMPPDSCGVLDLFATVGDTAAIDAGDTVELTLESMGDTQVVTEGHDLMITGDGGPNGMQLLSSDGCATATTTLEINNVIDADEAAGLQVEIQVCGRATTDPAEPVTFTVVDANVCDAEATSDAIDDVQPAEPINIAVVDIATGLETGSVLDEINAYTGTDPVVIGTPVVVEEITTILDAAPDGCDLQWWDQYTNVVDATPSYDCRSESGLVTVATPGPCELTVFCPPGLAGTTQTIICEADFDEDDVVDASRSFAIAVVAEIGEEVDPGNPATSLVGAKEGPQDVNGNQVNPPAGGEAIIRIGVNGDLDVSFVNVNIDFAEGSVPGAELRGLNGTPISLPLPVSITDTQDARYVVYAPAAGQVIVTATELSNEGLTPGGVTVVFGAACAVSISPANPTVPTETTQQFNASTDCGSANPAEPAYTWEIVAAETTGTTACSGSTISATGLYTAAATDTGCVDTVKVTDTANGNATAETTVTVIACTEAPVVTVTPASPECVAQEFCAATTLCGASVDGTYTWTVTGGTADTTSGECINVTPEGTASFTVTATDTANMNAQDSVSGDCVGIEATFTGCGTQLLLWFGVVEIQGTGTDFGLFSITRYDSPLVVKGIKLVNRADQTITQFVLLLPSLFFPAWDYPAMVEVTVDGLADTFEIPACGG